MTVLALFVPLFIIACHGMQHARVREATASETLVQVLQDAPLTRHAANPLLSKGPAGSFDQAKIGPRAILRDGTTGWKMWYEAGTGANKGSAAYATSPDGIKWAKYAENPVMVPTEPWEGGANGVVGEITPTTVLKENDVYKMWYHAIDARKVRQIGYATSSDGINWSKFGGNPILKPGHGDAWDAGGIGEPTVIKVRGTFFMYYMRTVEQHGIGLATSPDGINWTKYSANPILTVGKQGSWDDGAMQVGGVFHDGTLFHMWFRARDAEWNFAIGYAWSADGKSWTKSPRNPLLAKPNRPLGKGDDFGVESNTNVFRVGNEWWLYYGGFVSCCPENVGVNLATAPIQVPRVSPKP